MPSSLLGSLFEILALVCIAMAVLLLIIGSFQIGTSYLSSYEDATILVLVAIVSTLQAIYLNRK